VLEWILLSDWTMTSIEKVDMNDRQATIVNFGSPNDTLMSFGAGDDDPNPLQTGRQKT